MAFEPNDPKSLKVVYWINVVLVALLVVLGFVASYLYSPLLAFVGIVGAVIYWFFFTKALKNKKKYSYWLNMVWHAFTIISRTFYMGESPYPVGDGFFILISAVIIYFLLQKDMRGIFISRKASAGTPPPK